MISFTQIDHGGCFWSHVPFITAWRWLEHGWMMTFQKHLGMENHPNRRTHIFQRGRYTTNQINIIINYESSLTIINHKKGMIGFRWLSDSLNHHENPVALKPPGAQRRRASSGGFWRFSPCSWGTQGGLGFPWDSSGKIWKICSWSEKELFFTVFFHFFPS